MEIPERAIEVAAYELGPYADENRDHSAAEAAIKEGLSWLVENDPGFLLRLVFSEEEICAVNKRFNNYGLFWDESGTAAQRKLRSALREPERSEAAEFLKLRESGTMPMGGEPERSG